MKYRGLIMYFVILIVMSGCVEKPARQSLGKAAPFRLIDADSTYRQLTDFKSKIVMIHFWADWCPHCRQEFPELQKAFDTLKDQGLLIVGINSGQPFEHMIGIQQEFNLTFPMLSDEEAITAKKYKVSGLPASFYIDKDGNILQSEVGWVTEEKIVETYKQLTSAPSS